MACIFCNHQIVHSFYSPSYYYSCFECDFVKNKNNIVFNKYSQTKPCKFCNNRNTKLNNIMINSCINCAKKYNLEFSLFLKQKNNELIKFKVKSKDTLNSFKYNYRIMDTIKISNIIITNSAGNDNLLDLGFFPNTEFNLEN